MKRRHSLWLDADRGTPPPSFTSAKSPISDASGDQMTAIVGCLKLYNENNAASAFTDTI